MKPRRLDPVSQLFISAFQYATRPRTAGPGLAAAARDWLEAFPDERAGAVFELADEAKDVGDVVPVEREESGRTIGIALTRAMAEHRRRLAEAAVTPPSTRWDERADLA
jgi:hypothetical protein